MDYMDDGKEIRVPFDDGPSHTITLETAEKMLRAWRKENPYGFGVKLAEALGLDMTAPPKTRARK